MISAVHHSTADNSETGRLEIVNFYEYNLTKYGVYSLKVSRCTIKLPEAIFFMVWDVSPAETLSMKHIRE